MTLVASKPAASWPWLKSYPPGIDWQAELKPRPLYRLLDDAAARHGDKSCIDFLDRRWSFAQIKALSDRFARGLIRGPLGVVGEAFGFPGQTVAGLASLGACFLVWTGLPMAWRAATARTLIVLVPVGPPPSSE